MGKKIATILLTLCVGVCFSQNKQLLYGLSEVPQSLLVNPGEQVQLDKYIGIPFFSQIHVNAGSSGVNGYDIFQESTTNINTRITQAIQNMDHNDYFTATQQLEVINFGWRSEKEIFFSAGMYQEFDFISYFPKDLAVLAWEGNRDYIGRSFDLSEVNVSGEMLTVFHFGANKQISEKWTFGARFKIYSSMYHFRSTNNQGTFTTRIADGSENIYDHLLENADVLVETSGFASYIDSENLDVGDVVKSTLKRAFLGGNLGVGIDIGATYQANDNWTFSGSILDAGVVFHNNEIRNYRGHGTYNLSGINLLFPSLQDGESTYEYYQNLEDEIENEVPIDTLYNKYTAMRPTKFNLGIKYKDGRFFSSNKCNCLDMGGGESELQSFGLQLYGITRPKRLHYAATLFYYRRLTNTLSGKVTYTVDDFSYDNIGLAAVGNFGKFNAYLAVDNLLRYSNLAKANSLSLQLGFNLIFNE